MHQKHTPRRRGVTIVEVLVVIGIIALLVALILPAVQSSRSAARKVSCSNNLRQIGLALQNYHDQFSVFPPAAVWAGPPGEPLARNRIPIGVIDRIALGLTSRDADRLHANWLIMLLPSLGESAVWNSFNSNLLVADTANAAVCSTPIAILKCPDDPFNSTPYSRGQFMGAEKTYARGNYAMNMGPGRYCIHEMDPKCVDGFHVDDPDLANKNSVLWGSGAGGVNKSFSLKDCTGGASNFVLVDEIRAGVAPTDSRGSWALGFIGSSLTARHGLLSEGDNGPNNQNPEVEQIVGCRKTIAALGADKLEKLRMPCRLQGQPGDPEMNGQATSRSMHPAGVNVLAADGSVHFVADTVNPDVWFYMHNREPAKGFSAGF
ncbi:DUF1559 domain-containing protein [Schlesneria paludicola]|uniref:DUF1559 domain-containing protein n=1 Tax=Schlesneria paludicola TaxID=360056 RepID=UPI00029A2ED5|nr:DUF1559 domain-containing protein [Schlesneria paludicola]